ncbi:hypothetical protein [Streptomyces sp. cmx-4-25]|uniref:hypothetical protein n=1 Tax=Streptomyces sp. cmx-4-25 TaxID=2790933 RepID=UPI003980CC5C
MSKPNTRQFDKQIEAATRKLQGVRARELWALPAGDQAKVAGYVGVAFAKATRLKSSPMAERGIDRIWANAEAALTAEIAAAEKAKVAVLAEHAAAKVAKRAESKWW